MSRRLPDSPSRRVSNSPTRRVAESESRRLAESVSRFSIMNISANSKPKAECSKATVRDLWGPNFCKNLRKSASLTCPFNLSMLPTLGRTFQPVRHTNFETAIFFSSLTLIKRGQFFFSAAKFYGHSGQIVWKRVPSTGRRANKCQQITIFLQAHFKGKQTNDRKKGLIFHKGLHFTNRNWHNVHGYFE